MVRNKLTDLTNTLFGKLETLDDRDLTADELKTELQRSKQMVAISSQILQLASWRQMLKNSKTRQVKSMPRSLCWKDEYTEYMHEICHGRLTPEVTRLLNEKFGTNYTKTQIGGVRKRLGLPVGKIYQGRLLTREQHDYLVSIQKK